MTTPTNTPTPRTDALAKRAGFGGGVEGYIDAVYADFARLLERENQQLQRERDEALEHQEVPFHTCAGEKCQNKYCQLRQENERLKQELAEANAKIMYWALGVEQSNTDIVDMQRDEFKRIIALLHAQDTATVSEIVGICKRAIQVIEQTCPVVKQRDHFKLLAEERWQMCEELAESLAKAQHKYRVQFAIIWDKLKDYETPYDDALSHFHSLQQQKKDE